MVISKMETTTLQQLQLLQQPQRKPTHKNLRWMCVKGNNDVLRGMSMKEYIIKIGDEPDIITHYVWFISDFDNIFFHAHSS